MVKYFVDDTKQELYEQRLAHWTKMDMGPELSHKFAYRDALEKETRKQKMEIARAARRPEVKNMEVARNAALEQYAQRTFQMSYEEYEDLLIKQENSCGICKSSQLKFSPKFPYHPIVLPNNLKVLVCRHCEPCITKLLIILGTNLASETK